MTFETNSPKTESNVEAARQAWVKPEITSFEVVSATQAATSNPGDGTNSNS